MTNRSTSKLSPGASLEEMVDWINERVRIARAQHNNNFGWVDGDLSEEDMAKTDFAKQANAIIAALRAGQAMREANRDGSTAARMCASEAWDAALGEKE